MRLTTDNDARPSHGAWALLIAIPDARVAVSSFVSWTHWRAAQTVTSAFADDEKGRLTADIDPETQSLATATCDTNGHTKSAASNGGRSR